MNFYSQHVLELFGVLQDFSADGISAAFSAAKDDGKLSDDMLLAMLPESEKTRSNAFLTQEERRHFLFRRCFQQVFVARHIGWQLPVHALSLVHLRDEPPKCIDAPKLNLSFTSSAKNYLFGAAENAVFGVDIERERLVQNAPALAQRFFSVEEAESVARRSGMDQSQHFLTLWSAKEAGLKAMGQGVVDGLNTFIFTQNRDDWNVKHWSNALPGRPWQLRLPNWMPGYIVAVMHKSTAV